MKSDCMNAPRGLRVAQCWYSARDYKEIKVAMEDSHRLPERYEEWLAGAEQREDQARSKGATPVRIAFDLAEFLRFCKHFRIAINAESRSKFAAVKSQVDDDAASGTATERKH